MSTPLKDFRLPIPEHVHMWLEAEAQAFGTDMQTIVGRSSRIGLERKRMPTR
jgi:hypothetical protein